MGRVKWLAFFPKSTLQNFLSRQTFSIKSSICEGVLRGTVPQSHQASFHSPTAHSCSYIEERAGFATSGHLRTKRFIHATVACRSTSRDYYEILGISKDASQDEIKKAFHALAKKYHPDANKNNPSAKKKFQEIRDAYETLQDPEKKEQYDRMTGHSRRTKNSQYAYEDADSFRYAHRTQFSDSFHKIFSEIFNNGADNFAADIQVDLKLSFSEAVKGCTKHFSFDADVPCDSCHGLGHPLNAKPKPCSTCQGTGRVTIPPFSATCGTCKGFGQIIKDYCGACGGSGVVEGFKDVKVTVPAGVDSGDIIRVPKAGNTGGRGMHPGNLIIKLKVADDPLFSREGADIYLDFNITFTQAILGGKVEVPTLSGKVQLQIPKGVQPGQLVLLRGKGLPKSGFLVDHGDQYVRFRISFPSTVTDRQRAILDEFEKEEIIRENNLSAEGTGWHQMVERLLDPKLLLQFSFFMLIILLLNKAT
ncbi:Chaperone protein dnaJ 1 [Abeliophyllum distichum]|uniref:Chaperone protein dnaJ 1 n=1 Tax=Abeliophyllum distichum TaxID=126358 RepID=A0ABD1SV41_9LAMI